MDICELKRAVMEELSNKCAQYATVLRRQYELAEVVRRNFTGCGFFTEFHFSNLSCAIPGNIDFEPGCQGELIGVNATSVGYVLFVRQGLISVMEGYTYGNERWPGGFESYTLSPSL